MRQVQARTEAELEHIAVQPLAHRGADLAERVTAEHDVRDPGHDLVGVEAHAGKGTFEVWIPPTRSTASPTSSCGAESPDTSLRPSAAPRTR